MAIDELMIDMESVDADHRLFKFHTPNFRMVTTGGQPAFKQIGDERIIKHGTVHIIRVRQVSTVLAATAATAPAAAAAEHWVGCGSNSSRSREKFMRTSQVVGAIFCCDACAGWGGVRRGGSITSCLCPIPFLLGLSLLCCGVRGTGGRLQGSLCRVWSGSQPLILQPKDDPYVFNSPVFRLAKPETDGCGCLRVLPRTCC